jgi:hypothetical protein
MEIKVNGRPIGDFTKAVQEDVERLIRNLQADETRMAAPGGGTGGAPQGAQGSKEANNADADEVSHGLDVREFDWGDDADDVVVPPTPAVAVYENVQGQVCIRSNWLDGEEDQVVVFAPEYAVDVAEKILAVAREAISP